ncbi:MAG: hypothetical protein MZU84_05670 [Sphingobacterium sp.]|nr:hypothetical protein [Sphingobacterium sp.]
MPLENGVKEEIDIGRIGDQDIENQRPDGLFPVEQPPAEKAEAGMGDRAHAAVPFTARPAR